MTSSYSEGGVRDVQERGMGSLHCHAAGQRHLQTWGACLYIDAMRVAAQEVAGAARVGDRRGGPMHCVGCIAMLTMFSILHNRVTL